MLKVSNKDIKIKLFNEANEVGVFIVTSEYTSQLFLVLEFLIL